MEVLVSLTLSTFVMIALTYMVNIAVAAQDAVKTQNGLSERAAFALKRISAAIANAPVKQLGPNPGDWLLPVRYALAAGGVLIEYDGTGWRVIATGVSSFTMASPVVVAGRPVIEVALALEGGVTQRVSARLGGPA